jgi:hypothetical protein
MRAMSKALALLLAILGAGCGTILASSTRPVLLQSSPPGANVSVDGQPVGSSPITVSLDNHKSHTVTFAGPGNGMCVIESSVGPVWVILDVLFGLLPLVVDAATGAWSEINNPSCAVILQ